MGWYSSKNMVWCLLNIGWPSRSHKILGSRGPPQPGCTGYSLTSRVHSMFPLYLFVMISRIEYFTLLSSFCTSWGSGPPLLPACPYVFRHAEKNNRIRVWREEQQWCEQNEYKGPAVAAGKGLLFKAKGGCVVYLLSHLFDWLYLHNKSTPPLQSFLILLYSL